MSGIDDTFIDRLKYAESLALAERGKAEAELKYARTPGTTFKAANKDQAQKRMETANKIAGEIRKAIRAGFPPL